MSDLIRHSLILLAPGNGKYNVPGRYKVMQHIAQISRANAATQPDFLFSPG